MKKVLILIAMLISTSILADSEHRNHKNNTTVVNETTNVYNTTQSTMAMAMAQHHFSYGNYVYQKSVSAAGTEDSIAASAAMAHRDCADCGLFSGSVAIDTNSDIGFGIGYTWNY